MAVFRIEKTRDYTVMSNHHLRDRSLSLKAKGLLSLMLSLPEEWDYFQITPASISYHLSLLQKSGLISCFRVERRRIYRLNHDALDELYLWLQNLYKTKLNK